MATFLFLWEQLIPLSFDVTLSFECLFTCTSVLHGGVKNKFLLYDKEKQMQNQNK